MSIPEIKVGQRWSSTLGGNEMTAKVEWVTETDVFYVAFRKGIRAFSNGETREAFLKEYKPIPEPKTRDITVDDIMKMLSVNPVVFAINRSYSLRWYQLTAPGAWLADNTIGLAEYQFSHNPFAPNPVIVGPKIEVVE